MRWFRKTIDKLRYSVSRDRCYSLMYEQDVANKFGCPGITGGDKNSGYLYYRCTDCPYLVVNKEG